MPSGSCAAPKAKRDHKPSNDKARNAGLVLYGVGLIASVPFPVPFPIDTVLQQHGT